MGLTSGLWLALGLVAYAVFLCCFSGKARGLMLLVIFAALLLSLLVGGIIGEFSSLRGTAALFAMFMPAYGYLTAGFVFVRIVQS